MFKLAIFDLDGVVVNTIPLHFQAWKRMFSEYQKEFTFQDYIDKVDGIAGIDGARNILTDIPFEELKKATERKYKYYLELLTSRQIPVFEDTLAFIKTLKVADKKIALISSSRNCREIVEKAKISSLFDCIVTTFEVKKGKPNPDIFLLAADQLAVTTDEAVVFEDAVLGIEAALSAKMVAIGVDRYNLPSRLSKADKVINGFSQMTLSSLEELF